MMSLAPWLAVAGLGALHGLNPVAGWMFVAIRGRQSNTQTRVFATLRPIAIGHVLSVVLVAGGVTLGLTMNRQVLVALAAGLALVVAIVHFSGRLPKRVSPRNGPLGLALWSIVVATAHGTGIMLVPALIPICISDSPARAIVTSGSVLLAVLAVAIHLASMLTTVGIVGLVARTSLPRGWRWIWPLKKGSSPISGNATTSS